LLTEDFFSLKSQMSDISLEFIPQCQLVRNLTCAGQQPTDVKYISKNAF